MKLLRDGQADEYSLHSRFRFPDFGKYHILLLMRGVIHFGFSLTERVKCPSNLQVDKNAISIVAKHEVACVETFVA